MLNFKSKVFILLLFINGFFAALLSAQSTESQTTQSLLPEINPQDIEIRGVFKASFPGIRRQPILGFNPKPRVYRVDPNRLPFMEDDRAAAVQLPIQAFEQSEKQPDLPIQKIRPANGYFNLGGANYLTGLVEAAYRHQLTEKTEIDLFGRYFLTDGHTSSPVLSNFEQRNIQLSAGHQISKTRHLQLHTFYEGGYLYQPVLQTVLNQAQKTVNHFGFNLNHEAIFNPVSHSRLFVYANHFDLRMDRKPGLFDLSERLVGTSLKLTRPGSQPERVWGIALEAKAAFYDSPTGASLNAEDWSLIRANVSTKKRLNDQSTLLFQAGAVYADAINTSTLGIYPEFGVQLKRDLSDAFSFELRAFLNNDIQSMSHYQQQNPFIDLGISSPLTTEYGVGIKMAIQPVSASKLQVQFSFKGFQDYAFFSANMNTNSLTDPVYFGLGVAEYARMPELSIQYIQYAMGQKLRFDGHYTLRQPELTGELLPSYVPQMEALAQLSYRLDQKIDLWLKSQFVGSRYTQIVGVNQADKEDFALDPYFLMHSGATYAFAQSFSASLSVLNLLNTEYEYWQGYIERTAEVRLELIYRF